MGSIPTGSSISGCSTSGSALALGASGWGFESSHSDQKFNTEVGDLLLVSEAAKKLGMNTQTLRLALQQGLFDFGTAVKTSEKRFTYYICPKRLERYINGD